MPELLLVAAAACAAMTVAVLRMVRPPRRAESVIRSLLALVLGGGASVALGAWTGAESVPFLLASSFALVPVALLVDGAAEEAAPGQSVVAWTLVLVWAGIVYPLAAIAPSVVFAGCEDGECRVEDFGGALALFVSAAASVMLAWRAPSSDAREGWGRFALPAVAIWASGAVWLSSLEGVVDAYTPRILLAAVLAPVGGAAAWLLVDLLRRARRHPVRSAADGLLAGLVAIAPGAAGISFPWSLAVGALAGAAAALVYGSRRLSSGGRAGHWALVVLASTAVGYLAPAVSGDTVGFVFSGRITALFPPVAAFAAVAGFGLLASIPAWLLARRSRRTES